METIQQFPGFNPPESNYTLMPNELIEVLPLVETLAELKVLLYILRHTWGYQEFTEGKRITLDEFMHGRKRRDGSRYDNGVGMVKNSIIDGLERAVTHHFISIETDDSDKARIEKYYSLVMFKNCTPDVQKLNLGTPKVEPRSEKETIEINNIDSAPANAARIERPKPQSMVEGYTPHSVQREASQVNAASKPAEPEKKESSAKERKATTSASAQKTSPQDGVKAGDETTKPAKSPRKTKAPLAPVYSNPLIFDTISATFFAIDDPEDAKDLEVLIGLCRKALIRSVLRKRKEDDLTEPLIDELCAHLRQYGLWWDWVKKCTRPRNSQKFMGGWHEYSKSPDASNLQRKMKADPTLAKKLAHPEPTTPTSGEPETYEHPSRPGVRVSKAQYRQLLASLQAAQQQGDAA